MYTIHTLYVHHTPEVHHHVPWTLQELLALFSNPRMPTDSGIRPLAFGKDLKHLMKALPVADLAIEPAATLVDAQKALITHSPRVLVFSGREIE